MELPGARHGWVERLPPDSREDVLCLCAGGRFDLLDLEPFAEVLRASVTAGHARVELDIEHLAVMDTWLLRVLLEARRLGTAAGCSFRLVNVTGRPALVIDVTGTRGLLCD